MNYLEMQEVLDAQPRDTHLIFAGEHGGTVLRKVDGGRWALELEPFSVAHTYTPQAVAGVLITEQSSWWFS